MEQTQLLPHLFRTEYRKIVSVLCALFGIEHIETAEDIVSDTFLAASESWSLKGLPENPTAWLYTVAKNKARNSLNRHALFASKVVKDISYSIPVAEEIEIDLSSKSIHDSQLAMMFTVCHPAVSAEAQVALALNLLCGFGIQEIADAFLTNKDVIYKRLSRAKEKLKAEKIKIEQPTPAEMEERLDTVLTSLYLLFSEGYYSVSQDKILRKDLCAEAMRLNYLLIEHAQTNRPAVNALFALMSFHSSRFDARINQEGEIVLYEDQDVRRWNHDLITQGTHYLNLASQGNILTRYHLEAGIAFWHTQKKDSPEKWDNILQLYNHLLQLAYSPIAALNRTYALSKVYGKKTAIAAAEKLQLTSNHFYFSLLGNLYTNIDDAKALEHFRTAENLANSQADKTAMSKNIASLLMAQKQVYD